MDVFYSYTYGTAGWLALQAVPLMIVPRIITTLLSAELREPTSLEVYFSRSLGLALLTLGIMVVLLTGSVPLTSTLSDTTAAPAGTEASDPKAPYVTPTLIISMLYHSTVAMYCYGCYYSIDGTSMHMMGCLGSAALAALALWIVLFGTGDGRISRKTGADKRTSGFPFGNKMSASARKKQIGKAI